MKPKFYFILEQAIEQGISRGYYKAHKHIENPSEDAVISSVQKYVMESLHEYFDFDEFQ